MDKQNLVILTEKSEIRIDLTVNFAFSLYSVGGTAPQCRVCCRVIKGSSCVVKWYYMPQMQIFQMQLNFHFLFQTRYYEPAHP